MTDKDRKDEFIIFRVTKAEKESFLKKVKKMQSNASKIGRELVQKFLK